MSTTKDQFFIDVHDHQLTVIKDDGLYRHLRLSRPKSSTYRFDIITWPGYLAVAGDMGEWVFTRLDDMFEFFRGGLERPSIDYWAEKCRAADRTSRQPIYEFDRAMATLHVEEWIDDYIHQWGEGIDNSWRGDSLRGSVLDSLESAMNDEETVDAFFRWMADVNEDGFTIDYFDMTFRRFQRWSFAFEWICYAIPWAIDQYDSRMSVETVALDTTP